MNHLSKSLQPQAFIALAGPTASGKSASAMALAQALPIEIISVDSALVYKGMDIGTAKPTVAERKRVPHHLIDLIEPHQAFSAAQFVVEAKRLIPEIHARGRLPVLVGGTMLYFKALLHGLDELPATDSRIREQIDREAAALGWPALHAQLAAVDPQTARRLPPNDAQRIQRALEVYRSSGQPLSAFHTQPWTQAQPLGMESHCLAFISLEPQERRQLHERIMQRFDVMLAQGFVDEVRRLRQRGDLRPTMPSMRCVGYRQVWEALDTAGDQALSDQALQQLRERGIAATRQLAKRQLTWLRGMPARHVVASDAANTHATVIDVARRCINASSK